MYVCILHKNFFEIKVSQEGGYEWIKNYKTYKCAYICKTKKHTCKCIKVKK